MRQLIIQEAEVTLDAEPVVLSPRTMIIFADHVTSSTSSHLQLSGSSSIFLDLEDLNFIAVYDVGT
jgi:hypothetical protein